MEIPNYSVSSVALPSSTHTIPNTFIDEDLLSTSSKTSSSSSSSTTSSDSGKSNTSTSANHSYADIVKESNHSGNLTQPTQPPSPLLPHWNLLRRR